MKRRHPALAPGASRSYNHKVKQTDRDNLLNGVRDPRVRHAFARVDRTRFVPPESRSQAWDDHPLPIEDGATISQPSLVARMTELLELADGHRVLEIGSGSGYQTAILAAMGAEVFTVEVSALLSRQAEQRLRDTGYVAGIHFRIGDGRLGWPDAAPFDRILATVAFESLPEPLETQLRDGGILLAPIGPRDGIQELQLCRKTNGQLTPTTVGSVRFLSAYN